MMTKFGKHSKKLAPICSCNACVSATVVIYTKSPFVFIADNKREKLSLFNYFYSIAGYKVAIENRYKILECSSHFY